MRTFVIHNPAASRAANLSSLKRQPVAADEIQWCQTGTADHNCARQLARHAVADGFDRIVIIGGDGTINEVVNAIAPEFSIELAVVPCGTGNDLARSIGVPLDSPKAALEIALQSGCRPVDVIQIETNGTRTYCVNAINGGLGGCVAEDVQSDAKKQWGALAYWFTAISLFGHLPIFQTELEIDGKLFEYESTGIAIANGCFVGGGFPIAPKAILDDGLLDISVAPTLPTIELMAAGLNFVLGRHEREDRIQTLQARSLRIRSEPPMPFSIDGEPFRSFDANFILSPSAVKLVTGNMPVAFK